jgi:hypothetical protein
VTEAYKKRLIELAKEIIEMQDGFYIGKQELLRDKINHLLGYILALEDHSETRKEDAKE